MSRGRTHQFLHTLLLFCLPVSTLLYIMYELPVCVCVCVYSVIMMAFLSTFCSMWAAEEVATKANMTGVTAQPGSCSKTKVELWDLQVGRPARKETDGRDPGPMSERRKQLNQNSSNNKGGTDGTEESSFCWKHQTGSRTLVSHAKQKTEMPCGVCVTSSAKARKSVSQEREKQRNREVGDSWGWKLLLRNVCVVYSFKSLTLSLYGLMELTVVCMPVRH